MVPCFVQQVFLKGDSSVQNDFFSLICLLKILVHLMVWKIR